MNIQTYLSIAKLVNDCPNCGYNMVGTDEKTGDFHGSLNVDDNLFTRKCRCGFEITINSDKGTTKKIVTSQIDEALESFQTK